LQTEKAEWERMIEEEFASTSSFAFLDAQLR
jgi:hypothetical protein